MATFNKKNVDIICIHKKRRVKKNTQLILQVSN